MEERPEVMFSLTFFTLPSVENGPDLWVPGLSLSHYRSDEDVTRHLGLAAARLQSQRSWSRKQTLTYFWINKC